MKATHEARSDGAAASAMMEQPRTLADVLRARAASEAERIAYTFLADGEGDERTVSYVALDAQAERVAAALAQREGGPRRALLMYPPGLDFIAALFGCFRAGVVAVPVPPPDPRDVESGLVRVERVAADADASIVLTTDAVWAAIQPWAGRVPTLMQREWCATDAVRMDAGTAWHPPIVRSGDVALLQYTSGSTGTPRGVMVTHANILAHGRCAIHVLALSSRSVVVGWLPLYHDMGLVGTVLMPMQLGCPAVHLSPSAFLQRPLRWLQTLSRYGGTVSPAPNFAYDLCVRKTTPAERRGLDLSRWTAAMNGAEPVRAETCDRFVAAFEPHGFRREAFVPCYGLAEATLMVSGGPAGTPTVCRVVDGTALDRHRLAESVAGSPGSRTIVGCGRIVPEHRVAIVDPETRTPSGLDQVGEIWVAGPCVTAGYWSRADDTAAAFDARLAGDDDATFLRTGDLGFVRDGILFVTGRHKDLIVIRGRNHYPQDIERTAEGAHAALRPGCGAAFSITDGNEERLAIVHEVDPKAGAAADEVARAIRAAIAREHQVHAHVVVLIPPRTLPKTSSGKIRRRETRTAFEGGRLPAVDVSRDGNGQSAASDLGAWIVDRIAELRDVPPSAIGRDEVFLELGIDSAEAAELVAALEERVGRRIPMRIFLEHPTIDGLARALAESPA